MNATPRWGEQHLEYIFQLTADLCHVKDEYSCVADALQRIVALSENGSSISKLIFTLLADVQVRDRQLFCSAQKPDCSFAM